jgi:predicted alpha/beta hydrolase
MPDAYVPTLTIDEPAERSARTIVLLAAMGVPAKYYDKLVANFLRLGHPVVRLRWRDEDRQYPIDHPEHGYADLAELDMPFAVAAAREHFGEDPLVVGHSLGGQIACIGAAKSGPIAGIAIVASGSNYWRGVSLRWALGIGFVTAVVAPLVVKVVGYWPGGRLNFGGRQAARMMRDWARFGRTGKFLLEGATVDHEAALRELDVPVLAMSIYGDHYVPRAAHENLLKKLERCRIERFHWRPEERSYRGHFNWVRADEGPAEIIHEWSNRDSPSSAHESDL